MDGFPLHWASMLCFTNTIKYTKPNFSLLSFLFSQDVCLRREWVQVPAKSKGESICPSGNGWILCHRWVQAYENETSGRHKNVSSPDPHACCCPRLRGRSHDRWGPVFNVQRVHCKTQRRTESSATEVNMDSYTDILCPLILPHIKVCGKFIFSDVSSFLIVHIPLAAHLHCK